MWHPRRSAAWLARTYPRDAAPRSLLSGGVSIELGQYEKGAEEAQKSIEIDPDNPFAYTNLAVDDLSLGQVKQAGNALRQAYQRKLEIPDLFVDQYDIAFLAGDRAGMQRVAALSKGKPGVEDWIADNEAYSLAYYGHLRDARRMTVRAEALAQEAGESERMAQYETAAAVRAKLSSGTRLRRGDTRVQLWCFLKAATSSMARPSHLFAPGILPRLKHLRTIWKSDSPRTR